MKPVAFSPEMGLTLLMVGLAFYLFISERFSNDVNALIILVLLGVLSHLPLIQPLLSSEMLFSGFSSNAVIAIIALMIMAEGIERTGGMDRISRAILRYGNNSPTRLVALFCGMAGVLSGFVQNIGVVALCLPVASYISMHTNVSLQRLLMPMGFCVLLGGNLTLLGNGSLIILNDLISHSSLFKNHPDSTALSVFDVSPVGIGLLGLGITIFAVFNRPLFGRNGSDNESKSERKLIRRFGVHEVTVSIPAGHDLEGRTIGELENLSQVQVLAMASGSRPASLAPLRSNRIEAGAQLGLVGQTEDVAQFIAHHELSASNFQSSFGPLIHRVSGGYSEVVISSRSALIGKTLHELYFRKHHNATPICIERQKQIITGGAVNHTPLEPGDMLLLHSSRNAVNQFKDKPDLILVNTECAAITRDLSKAGRAATCFLLSIVLALFTSMHLGLCLWIGVLSMFLTGTIKPADAYQAVSWKTVVMLAGLIPLGVAIDHTGAAQWISAEVLGQLLDYPVLLQLVLVLLTTVLTLVMSNVGATILLVPVALGVAFQLDQSPVFWALLVGVASSNSFIIPTHQANALILNAGRYRVADFMRIGRVVTLVYIAVELLILNLMFGIK